MDRAASGKPLTLAPHCHTSDEPIPGTGQFDSEIHHDRVDIVHLFELWVVDADLGIEDLREDQNLVRALGESTQTHVAGVELHGVRLDARDPKHRHENPSARGKFDDHAQHARLGASDAHGDDQIAHTADRLTIGTENHQARQPGRKYLAQSCHDVKVRASTDISENQTGVA